jgi:ABC-type amino acid transport system permease subunit
MLAAAVLYFVIIYVLSTLSRALENRLSPPKARI